MDSIADMLIRIKNAQKAGQPSVEIPFSKLKFSLAKVLEKEKFVNGVEERGKKAAGKINIVLKYSDGKPAIQDIKRISRLSQRIYVTKDKIRSVKQGYGIAVISTSQGLMTNKEAKKAGLGGEIVCEVW